MQLRPYTFLGTTQSLCPDCLSLTPTKIVVRDKRVYFRKRCPTHGEREDFVCSDVDYYDQMAYALPAKIPAEMGVEPSLGCPYDCGLCTEHEQHTCIGLVEITSSCNLTCPMCFASSAPGGKHLSLADCKRAIDRLVEVEGRPEVMQLSGGEPTIHPRIEEILEYAIGQPIDYITINTNGIRFAKDRAFVERIAKWNDRVEIYFQMDGLRDDVNEQLRGERLLDIKRRALDILGEFDIHVTLAVTLQGGVNDDQMGPLVEFAVERPWITGISFQPATYSGRYALPEQLERRITFPDVMKGVQAQTNGLFRIDDFMPLPCAHPNCHSISYAYRTGGSVVPLLRFIDARNHLDILANGVVFTRSQARNVLLKYLGSQGCCNGQCGPEEQTAPADSISLPILDSSDVESADPVERAAAEFFTRAAAQQLGARDVFRITITSFLDAYNFDLRRLMKCCTHHILPSGHVVPFCAYNVLYREGHVALPPLRQAVLPMASLSTT